jgi:hypothetical protein
MRTVVAIAAAMACAGLAILPARAGERPAAPPAPDFCAAYGPGYKAVGSSGTCVKVTGSVEVDVSASPSGRHPSAADSTGWITTRPPAGGN